MNRRAILFIIGAVFCGFVAILLVNRYIATKEKTIFKGMEMTEILVVKKDVEAGAKIDREMLTTKKIPVQYVHGNAIKPEDKDIVIGQTVNFPLKQGDPILFTDLGEERMKLRMERLAGKVVKGERALSVAVDAVSGVSGLIQSNDHVDILGTFKRQDTGEESTITLLQNLTVLATGSLMSSERQTERGYNTITLLVTLQEAVALARAAGRRQAGARRTGRTQPARSGRPERSCAPRHRASPSRHPRPSPLRRRPPDRLPARCARRCRPR